MTMEPRTFVVDGGTYDEDRYWSTGGGKGTKLAKNPTTKKWGVVKKPAVPKRLPTLPRRTAAPKNDQSEHPEFDSAGFWDKMAYGEYMSTQKLLAMGFAEYFCTKGQVACEQWKHWLGASGGDLTLDPARLMNEDNFSDDVNRILDKYKDMATKKCTSATCVYNFSSGWAPTLATSDENPVREDYAGMGQVQLNVTGSVTVTKGKDGKPSVTGSYKMSIFKAWNFDPGEYPTPRGVELKHDFAGLPAHGYAKDFVLRGTSGSRPF
ncbi:hypothetical protein ACN27G_21855 [Plantactinospora sp. WMMB334]|uniref:hypothetical protein n=1 Tax=Plantactinospora sp. WMMB334 TaxID=3404119 RepID=UPI003B944247